MYAISWENATIGYHKKTILRDVSLDIKMGGFVLLYGDNGSGKTTLIKTLEEKRLLKSGKVHINREQLSHASYIAQSHAINTYFPLTVFETVSMGLYSQAGFLKSLFNVDRSRINEMLGQLDLLKKKDQLLSECSGGELKKTLLGRALIKNPSLLIMDEPFINVDIGSCKTITELLKTHNQAKKMTVIVISHNKGLIEKSATQKIYIKEGRAHVA